MNNIIRSQYVLIRQRIVMCAAIFIAAVGTIMFGTAFATDASDILGVFGIQALAVILFIPTFIISNGYAERVQMYEIMAGFRPHQILLGKVMAFMPWMTAFIASSAVMIIMYDSSDTTVQRVMIYSIICLRITLNVIFLSPVFKVMSGAPLCTLFLLMFGDSDMAEMMHTPFSLFGFVQCSLLAGDITAEYMIKVTATAVLSCVICYAIGHTTLKRKINLEPNQLN